MMENFWDNRYKQQDYVYGTVPNNFFKEKLDQIPHPGSILLPAEGEGRNVVYAAQQGWKVEAFDQSKEGFEKAMKLAERNKVSIHYTVNSFEDADYPEESFDVVALIYAHVSGECMKAYYQRLMPFLKKGGYIIFEGFSKQHVDNQKVNPHAGGPRDVDMLYSKEAVAEIFADCETVLLEDTSTELAEGTTHVGNSSIIRYIGRKEA